MSAQRWLRGIFGHLKRSPPTLGKASVTPKTRLHITCLQHQISWQIVWKPTPLRAFGTTSQGGHQALGRIKKNKPSGFLCRLSKGRNVSLQIKDSTPPEKMKKFLSDAIAQLSKTPATVMVSVLTGTCALTFRQFYQNHLVKAPLTDRMAFILQTNEEALNHSEVQAKLVLNEVLNGPNQEPKQDIIRLEGIMKRLLDANPELHQHLMPGGEWRIRMKKHFRDLLYSFSMSFDCGVMIFAADMMHHFDDDEIGFFMAHEMAHIVQHHENEHWSMDTFFYHYIYNILQPVKAALGDGKDIEDYIIDFKKALKSLGFPFRNIYTWEREADDLGYRFGSKACFDYRKLGPALRKQHKIVRREVLRNPDQRPASDIRHDPSYTDEDYTLFLLQKLDLQANSDHDSTEHRAFLFDRRPRHQEAEEHRREGKCPPLDDHPVEAVKLLSQKVDELNAARTATPQYQGEL